MRRKIMITKTHTEIERFLSLFEQLIEQTFSFVSQTDLAAYQAIIVDSDVMFLGTRVNKISVSSLIRHLILAEAHWFETVKSIENGGVIPFPANANLLIGVNDGQPLVEKYRHTYEVSRQHLLSLSAVDLEKQVYFAERQYTVMGFLWTVLGHHSFHLGQIDLLLRQQNIAPPEYMEWREIEGVIG